LIKVTAEEIAGYLQEVLNQIAEYLQDQALTQELLRKEDYSAVRIAQKVQLLRETTEVRREAMISLQEAQLVALNQTEVPLNAALKATAAEAQTEVSKAAAAVQAKVLAAEAEAALAAAQVV